MTINLGDFSANSVIYVPFHTFNSSGASVTISGLAVTDIEIYKNGSVTQRASDAGYTLLDTDGIDFDGITGIHGFSIDTSDNTDAGFFVTAKDYWVVVSAITADSQTVSFVAAIFSIENRAAATRAADIQARIPAALGANGNIKADLRDLNGVSQSLLDLKDFADDGYDPSTNKVQGVVLTDTASAVTNLNPIANALKTGSAVTGTLSASQMTSNVTGFTDNHFAGTVINFTSGTLVGVSVLVTGYVGSSGLFTFSSINSGDAPVNGTTFTIFGFSGFVNNIGNVTGDVYGNIAGSVNSVVTAVDVDSIKTSGQAAINLALAANTMVPALAITGTLTTTAFTTDLPSAVDDFYNGRIVIFTSGSLANQAATIQDYTGATGLITLSSALTAAPSNGNSFIVV